MNSIHDMGGMTGFGSINREEDEPIFHSEWERRVFALNVATKVFLGPVDRTRHAIERLGSLLYVQSSYYEKWLTAVENLSVELGYVRGDELLNGSSTSASELPHPAPDPEMMGNLIHSGKSSMRDIDKQAKFAVGDRVRARNINPKGHTRLARYVRGRVGTINMYHQCHVLPDTHAHDQGENPQPLYNVSFSARELWGDDSNHRDSVNIDLWEDYLEPVED